MAQDLPGHIRKAFKSIERFLPVVDLIIELLDARMPFSSRLNGLVDRLKKKSLLVLGKADLADPSETDRWCHYFSSNGTPAVALEAKNPDSVKDLRDLVRKITSSISETRGNKARRVMVIGIPNVGKSTLINALCKRHSARVANLPGVTRNIQWIKILEDMELLDLPGILDFALLKRGKLLRLINTLPGREMDPVDTAGSLFDLLVQTGNSEILKEYFLPPEDFKNSPKFDTFLNVYSEKMNFLAKLGVADTRRGATDFIKRFQNASFGRVTLERIEDIEKAEDI
ncbi:MAG: ribosome biogenesis GTPase YlqF [Candidatus Riflebacteria bacterium]|nr:ribosome biogenesis GTPase YlqF [Candidatus Riflebacteria bacterium]